jgi:hypothetical protein
MPRAFSATLEMLGSSDFSAQKLDFRGLGVKYSR